MTRLILALCAVALLGGCSVPIVGVTGIGVDGAGGPVGYLAVCDEHIDGATLYYDNPDQSSTDEPSLDAGSWTAVVPVTSDAVWTLARADAGWRAEKPMGTLDPGRQYTLYGWTRDNSSSTGDVTFTLADLEKLEPGQVRYLVGYDKEAEEDNYKVGSPDDFRAHSCSERNDPERGMCGRWAGLLINAGSASAVALAWATRWMISRWQSIVSEACAQPNSSKTSIESSQNLRRCIQAASSLSMGTSSGQSAKRLPKHCSTSPWWLVHGPDMTPSPETVVKSRSRRRTETSGWQSEQPQALMPWHSSCCGCRDCREPRTRWSTTDRSARRW